MYPDTDMPPIAVTPSRIERVRERLPQPTWERIAKARAFGVPEGLAGLVAISPRWERFEEALDRGIKGTLAASLLVEEARCLERRGVALDGVDLLEVAAGKPKKEWRAALLSAAAEAQR
jgi:Glu-tRNA(Gln) amidotransferase subunit E-like FAD-binding protein